MTKDFCLCNQLLSTMLNKLKHIWYAIWSTQFYITLILIYKSLIYCRVKSLPVPYKVLNNTYIGSCLNIKIPCVKKSTNVYSWNQFPPLVFRIGGWSLPM